MRHAFGDYLDSVLGEDANYTYYISFDSAYDSLVFSYTLSHGEGSWHEKHLLLPQYAEISDSGRHITVRLNEHDGYTSEDPYHATSTDVADDASKAVDSSNEMYEFITPYKYPSLQDIAFKFFQSVHTSGY